MIQDSFSDHPKAMSLSDPENDMKRHIMETFGHEWWRPELVVDKIITYIRESIAFGKLIPGQKINEKQFTTTFGFSRAPLREALRTLEMEGLIVIKPHKGAFVRIISETDLEEIFDMRMLIEVYGVERAFQNKNPELILTLEEILKHQQIHTEKYDYPEQSKYSNAFHDELMKAAGNGKLFHMYNSLVKPLRFILFMVYQNHQHAKNSIEEHYKLLDAFKSPKVSMVKGLFKQHIQWGYSISQGLLNEPEDTTEKK